MFSCGTACLRGFLPPPLSRSFPTLPPLPEPSTEEQLKGPGVCGWEGEWQEPALQWVGTTRSGE